MRHSKQAPEGFNDGDGPPFAVPAVEAEARLTANDRAAMERAALAAGFDKLGVASAPLPGSNEDRLQQERFTEWVQQGRAGEMAWLTRLDADGVLVRSSLHRAVPWVRSVVLCARVYNAPAPYSTSPAPAGTGWIGRYAWSGAASAESAMGEPAEPVPGLRPTDYHDVMLRRLRQVEAALHARHPGEDLQTRCYVDTGPVVERHLAQLAGVGWIGKNTCVLDQALGSWVLLATMLTSLPLAAAAELLPAADRCGSCTRCIDSCPTGALVAPRQMDASRCIAYLTIEKKGNIAEELRAAMGRQVFGCDICQDVCPWNRRAPIARDAEMQMRPELVNPPLEWLAAMDNQQFRTTFRGSPLERTGRRRLLRNVAIAMGNSGDLAHRGRLERWAAGPDELLAEAAQWALLRLAGDPQEASVAPQALLASV